MIGRIESEAKHNAGPRWLLGGFTSGPDEPFKRFRIEDDWRLKQGLASVIDPARQTPKHPLECGAMSVAELARAWVEQYSSKSERTAMTISSR